MDDETEVEAQALSRRFRRSDLWVLGFDLLSNLAAAAMGTLNSCMEVAVMHSNWEVDRDCFHEEAARELETLTAEEGEDG